MKKIFLLSWIWIFLLSCNKENEPDITDPEGGIITISAVDISAFPKIDKTNPVFYNTNGQEEDFLSILKNSGINTIRLRVWVNPNDEHSGFNEVKAFSETLKSRGFKIWLAPHYSDTWADPGHQEKPEQWENISYDALKDSVYTYTAKLINQIAPEYIQIGNEINTGFLFPDGEISNNSQQFKELLNAGIQAVRDNAEQTKIIIHFAGTDNSSWFFNQLSNHDYDIIGISYYPIWHGKNLAGLENMLKSLSSAHNKEIVIAETAYPFTLDYNDWTHNIVGEEGQLILPQYPATEQGQKDFMQKIKDIVTDVDKGSGFCYWGAELIAWDGPQSANGSPWENQSLFDFSNHALPVIEVFKKE